MVRVGPGYLTANPEYSDEPWTTPQQSVRYLPLQAQEGDFAFFLIDVEDHHLNFFVDGQHFRWMTDTPPAHVDDV